MRKKITTIASNSGIKLASSNTRHYRIILLLDAVAVGPSDQISTKDHVSRNECMGDLASNISS